VKFAKLATVLVALGSVLMWAAPAGADSSGSSLDNQAVAQVTGRYQVDHELAWSLAQVNQPSVTAVNEATATANDCLTCTAEAVAFQVVLASDTNTFVLTNTATSSNTDCVNCTTVSVAEQWVVGDTDHALRLTFAGQIRLFVIHLELGFWSHVPPAQGLPHILDLANQVSDILANDVVEVPNRFGPAPPISPAATPAVTPAATPAAITPLATPAPSGPVVQHTAQVSGP
jgi:hypothetical protein